MKGLVHHQCYARITILRQRQGNHCPGAPAPGKSGVGHVLILAQDRDERVAKPEESSTGNRVVGDDETGLPVHEGDGPANATPPERASIRFTRRSRIAQGGEGTRCIDLLGGARCRQERNCGCDECRLR